MVPTALALSLPVVAASAELTDVAFGQAWAAEVAATVLPVLVAEDWARERPELPDMAVGERSTDPPPPSPPLASPEAMESPPAMLPPPTALLRPRADRRLLTSPARAERAVRRKPPSPP